MELSERRKLVAESHKAQEKYDPHWKEEARQGRNITRRPVAFICDDEIVLLKDDAAKVHAGLKEFLKRNAVGLRERAKKEPSIAQAIAKAEQATKGKAPDEIRVNQQVWNAYALALGEIGMDVVLTDGLAEVPVEPQDKSAEKVPADEGE